MEPLTEPEPTTASGTTISVHAGFPNPAAERSGTPPLSLDRLLVRHPSSTFFFRIRGHNWQDQGIFDGDIAVVDRALTPHGDNLVVWWQADGAFALSTYRHTTSRDIWGTITAIIHSLYKN